MATFFIEQLFIPSCYKRFYSNLFSIDIHVQLIIIFLL